jgi:hypothetical protein
VANCSEFSITQADTNLDRVEPVAHDILLLIEVNTYVGLFRGITVRMGRLLHYYGNMDSYFVLQYVSERLEQ